MIQIYSMNWEQLLSSTRSGSKISSHQKERSSFEADYDRIIFSYPFRRLQDKTQVFPLPEQDFVHNRLTHSLEVSSVGRTLGKRAGEKIIEKHKLQGVTANDIGTIVSAAALAHDVGNPPFGHSGEESISSFFQSNKSIDWLKENTRLMAKITDCRIKESRIRRRDLSRAECVNATI